MAVVLIDETTLTGIANAIRSKLSTQATYQPGQMAAAISSISGGGSATLGTKTITSNATYNASSDNLDGYSSVTVNVPTGAAKSSSDLTANNLTVTAPAGLYSSDASKTLTDANLIAGNIKKDVTIFGVTGTYEGGGGGSSIPCEAGSFTIATKTDTYEIQHSLGVTPNFVIIYPIDVYNETSYTISSEFIIGDVGQSDWDIGTSTTQKLANHGFWNGNWTSGGSYGGSNTHGMPIDPYYAGLFTSTTVKVGKLNGGSNGGLVGTYGYILGVIPTTTS